MFKLLLAILALCTVTSVAIASDLPDAATAPAASTNAFSWNGAYIGGSVGYLRTANETADIDEVDYGQIYQTSADAALGSIHVGHNLQQGNTIFGVEADYGMPNTSTTFSTLWDPDEYFIVNELSTLGLVRGRLGVTLDRSLVYVTGGVAFGKVDNQYSYGNFSVSEKGWRNGWVGGAGIEHAIDQKLSIRAEGLYYDLGTESVSGLDNEIEKRFDFYNSALVARIGLS